MLSEFTRHRPPAAESANPAAAAPQIGVLTSLRFLAAVWVVLFHLQLMGNTFLGPVFMTFHRLIVSGDLGVDVFFILSGFIISYTYLLRLGPKLNWPGYRDFVWARFARMWPAFALVVGLLGLWFVLGTVQHSVLDWSLQARAPDLSAWGLAKQLLMIHLWFQPFSDGASWFGPGWTVSAEWLAYLAFPVAALGLYRLRLLHPVPALASSLLLMLPIALIGPGQLVDTGRPYPYSWLVRILCCFLAGAFAFLAARNSDRFASRPALAGPAAVIGILVVVAFLLAVPAPGHGKVVVLVFPALLALLSLVRGRARAALCHPWLLAGGRASYSLYLVHMAFIYLYHWLTVEVLPSAGQLVRNVLAVATLGGMALATYLLFSYVEEPARKRLRAVFSRTVAPATAG
ncbi:acyltransferase family protein [Arthrobacter sp. A5]|uniref:acyltransferase family protein n=1 Tax=Arthrobacter sp. A5 TaxID=576926 RepID=UPI003DA833B0